METTNTLVEKALKSTLDRRSFLRRTGGGAAALIGAGALLGAREASAQHTDNDNAILAFALNLEYLEAEYYVHAVTGQGIDQQPNTSVTGIGDPGAVVIKDNPKVNFKTSAIRQYAEEIAADELAHVNFLRTTLRALGTEPIARPRVDLKNSFNTLAKAAGIADTFDPFRNEVNFLLGAFIFEDVGVTAFKGAAALIENKKVLTAAAGILVAESYHAAIIRTTLFRLAGNDSSIIEKVQKISDLRDALDPDDRGRNFDRDRGIVDANGDADLFPSDANGLAFSRTTRQVLNIVYGAVNARGGLFFPTGLNGPINN